MGIRFRCPNGHKLHVKAFLAGKRGICPHCGEKFQIPLESDPALVKSSKHPSDDGKSAPNTEDSVTPTSATTDIAPENPAPAAIEMAEPKPEMADQQPIVNVNVANRPTVDVSDRPVIASSEASRPANEPITPVMQEAQPSVAAEAPAEGVDPIEEAPHAVWYVRPPSGGQFGPASADVMRSWITEGRVTADSLVWREGWPEWKQAGLLFPGVANANPNPSVSAVPRIVTQAGEGSSAELYRRRRSNKSTLMVVFMLLIACLILFGALVYVVRFMN